MNSLIVLVVVFLVPFNVFTQTVFGKTTSELYFNILTYQSDSIVAVFQKKYAPVLMQKPTGNWTAYPPTFKQMPEQLAVHSFVFTEHPHFKANFTTGQLDFLTRESDSSIGLRALELWFNFDTESSAKNTFTQLVNLYTPISNYKRVYKKNGKSVAEFKNKTDPNSEETIQFILVKDPIYASKYRIFFGNAIDFEIL